MAPMRLQCRRLIEGRVPVKGRVRQQVMPTALTRCSRASAVPRWDKRERIDYDVGREYEQA